MRVRSKTIQRGILGPVVALGLLAGVSVVAASPASADTAPLYTEDAIGVRVDRTAIDGPALDIIEAEIQPFVNGLILEGAEDDPPVGSLQDVLASANTVLDFQVNDPDGTYPDGSLEVNAVLQDIEIEFVVNAWWHSQCSVFAHPDDATIDITAKVDINRLPDTPIEVHDISATWDDNPSVSTTSFACDVHLAWNAFINFWGDMFDSSDPESTASKIEAMLDDTAQELLDDLWTDNVEPVLTSVEGFGVHLQEIYTDNQGLVVIADTDATGGIEIPILGGPFDVTDAAESGSDSDLHDLLSNRINDAGESHLIASIHPNVVNQYLHAFNDFQNGQMGTAFVSDDVADVLVDPADQGQFIPGTWSIRISPHGGYHTEPTGLDGLPQVQFPDVTVEFINSGHFGGFAPVATFHGDITGVDLTTEIRDESGAWGPGFSAANTGIDLTHDPAGSIPVVNSFDPDPSQLLPFVQEGITHFNSAVFEQYITLAPLDLGPLSVHLCEIAECGRYAGDERYTETLKVVAP